jgi:predicted enzyme related to lactoylglutathione lyase
LSNRALGLALDTTDPQELAPFWATALGYVVIEDVHNNVLLMPADGGGPKLLLQRVPEPNATKNRVHFDIEVADIERVASELERAGARLIGDVREEHGSHWIVMNDPRGNEFCVCDGGQSANHEG